MRKRVIYNAKAVVEFLRNPTYYITVTEAHTCTVSTMRKHTPTFSTRTFQPHDMTFACQLSASVTN